MPSLKPTRLTVNVPTELVPLVETRMAEEHYHSKSAYFIGLLLFDLVARSRHAITSSVLSDPHDMFEKVVIEIVRDFDKSPRAESGWFRKRVDEARRRESREKKKHRKASANEGG